MMFNKEVYKCYLTHVSDFPQIGYTYEDLHNNLDRKFVK